MNLRLQDVLRLHWGVQTTCAHAASLALSVLLPCCQLWPYTTALGFRDQPGTGEPADLNLKPPSPNPSEARGITCTRSPQHPASPRLALSGLDELKVNLCLFIAKKKRFRQAGVGQGQACSQVFCRAAASQSDTCRHLCLAQSCLPWTCSTGSVCRGKDTGAGLFSHLFTL